MITNLTVEHFKSLTDIELDLDDLTVFVGRNSVGKSNIVETLLFLRDCLDRGLDGATSDRYGIDSILQWSRYKPFRMLIKVNVEDNIGSGSYALRLSSKKREPIVVSESAKWTSRENNHYSSFSREANNLQVAGFGPDFDRFFPVPERRLNDDDLFLARMRVFPSAGSQGMTRLFRNLSSIQSYSIYPNVIRAPQKPSRDGMLSESGDNITSILKSMTSSKSARIRRGYGEIISSMRFIIPNLERILVRTLSGLLWLAFEVSEPDGKLHQLNTTQVSDGALRILGILVALYQPSPPRVMAIEEPEQNLHPGALGLLADAFNESVGEAQLLVTSHSPHLIDHFDIEKLRNVTADGSGSRVSRISEYQKDSVKKGLLSAGEIMVSQGFISK